MALDFKRQAAEILAKMSSGLEQSPQGVKDFLAKVHITPESIKGVYGPVAEAPVRAIDAKATADAKAKAPGVTKDAEEPKASKSPRPGGSSSD